MGMGIGARFFNGIKSAVNTVAVAEAHMAKTEKVKGPEKYPELGVLQFGSRFRGMDGAINPFNSGVRPATGPSVSRPGIQQFKGTGGAFAPEQGMQMSTGMRGLQDPVQKLGAILDTFAKNPGGEKFSSLSIQSPAQMKMELDAQGVPPDQQRMVMLQMGMQQVERMTQLITTLMKAAHDIALNSIRNLKG